MTTHDDPAPDDRSGAAAPGDADLHVDVEARRVTLAFRGTLDIMDLMRVVQRIAETDGYEPGMDAVYDLRNARFAFGQEHVQELRAWADGTLNTWGTGWRLAAVASDDVMFGYSRMLAGWFADAPWDARAFRDLESALGWLDEGRGRD